MSTDAVISDSATGADDDSGPSPEADSDIEPASAIDVTTDPGAAPGGSVDDGWLRARLTEAAALLPVVVGEVSVLVVGDDRMRALHDRHRGDDSTTDVLTFLRSAEGEPVEADIVVCLDEARRQAATRGHDVERELLLYALHALLHCAGHDDEAEDDAKRMHAEEDRILEAIGVGVTFARPPRDGDRDS